MLTNIVKRIGILVLLITVTLPEMAAAHGEGLHVFGTITALDAAEIQLLTTEGKTISISTVAETRYRNKGRGGGGNVPRVGDRVAIDVTEKDGKLMATEVQFSSFAKQQKP
ncbi:MAG: hypothetical protein CV088_19705 [Nitrospira sp. LK70]|nr:hypothetical protein [Nitrospira sp. LK70]